MTTARARASRRPPSGPKPAFNLRARGTRPAATTCRPRCRDIDARGGYSLWDRASFLALREHGSGLDILLEDYAALRTIYSVIAVNPAKHVGVNGPAAAHFVIWLTLEPTQFRIGTMTLDDKPAYFPEADAWQPTAAPD
ncbi:MAG: hypothetical protein M5R40_22785 [Anaerolineae bacterium]|nr:hypothetical protein [Anaerolineae bacterium]